MRFDSLSFFFNSLRVLFIPKQPSTTTSSIYFFQFGFEWCHVKVYNHWCYSNMCYSLIWCYWRDYKEEIVSNPTLIIKVMPRSKCIYSPKLTTNYFLNCHMRFDNAYLCCSLCDSWWIIVFVLIDFNCCNWSGRSCYCKS